MPKTITLRINEPLLERFKKHAEIENRSLSNFIETATLKYLEEIELADDFEMEDILNNNDLIARLKKGSDDASKKEEDSLQFKIFETDQFIEDFNQIKGKKQEKLYLKIKSYAYPQLIKNPYYGLNIKKLKNYKPETWRYRIGDYRLFYEINDDEKIISIIAFDTRQDAY